MPQDKETHLFCKCRQVRGHGKVNEVFDSGDGGRVRCGGGVGVDLVFMLCCGVYVLNGMDGTRVGGSETHPVQHKESRTMCVGPRARRVRQHLHGLRPGLEGHSSRKDCKGCQKQTKLSGAETDLGQRRNLRVLGRLGRGILRPTRGESTRPRMRESGPSRGMRP